MSEPSYVIGSSYSLNTLTEAERKHLDQAPWVFTCNAFLTHWEAAGFRPTVWCWGDNHNARLVRELDVQLAVMAEDFLLQDRVRYLFVCLENCASAAKDVVEAHGLLPIYYRRGSAWRRRQEPARQLTEIIYHYGSTLTNLVNFARILNPDGEIRLFGNEWGDGFGHFWTGPQKTDGPEFWQHVKKAMWQGLFDLRRYFGYPLVDCNRHEESLPEEFRLPIGPLIE